MSYTPNFDGWLDNMSNAARIEVIKDLIRNAKKDEMSQADLYECHRTLFWLKGQPVEVPPPVPASPVTDEEMDAFVNDQPLTEPEDAEDLPPVI